MKGSEMYSFLMVLGLLAMILCGDSSWAETGDAALSTGQPGMNTYPADQPGETAPLERPYKIAPPMIPHDVSDLEVSRAANDCIDCHLEGMELAEGHVATQIPASHYANEFTGERRKDTVVGIRYNCLQCHVPQATVEPGK